MGIDFTKIQMQEYPNLTDEQMCRMEWELVNSLNSEVVWAAVAVLADNFRLNPIGRDELVHRIAENRYAWVHGRTGEMSLHHGWGTSIRNLLRDRGFDEATLGVENLDEVYVVLVELALGFLSPFAPEE